MVYIYFNIFLNVFYFYKYIKIDIYHMGRGPNKHLKRLATPRKWMLSKMGGIYATRPS
jgi:hypothetical protein